MRRIPALGNSIQFTNTDRKKQNIGIKINKINTMLTQIQIKIT